MSEDVGEFQIPVKNFVLVEMRKSMDKLTHSFDSFILGQVSALFDVCIEISPIAILHNQVEVILSFLEIVQPNNVSIFTAFQHFDFAFEELAEFSCVGDDVPLTLSL